MTDSILSRERRKATVWIAATWFLSVILFAVAMYFTIVAPAPAERVIVLGVCGEFPIIRKDDGSLWLRINGLRYYRVESLETLVCK